MTGFLSRFRSRIGDFWWHSLMVFVACRAADLTNAFVGLWLVPKYVDPTELGAVAPLTQYANCLSLPAIIFATTFRSELTSLAVAGRYGQMKTLMRGVFVASAIFLALAIVASRFILPLFLERIRLVEGSLGVLILAVSFVSAVAPVYQNAMQSLKKFRDFSAMSVIGAPIRLLTMLVALPFRPIAGYFVGQASTPAFQIASSVYFLRKELRVKAEPYWGRSVVARFSMLFTMLAAGHAAGAVASLVESTVLRQRLPSIDSAGYYMVTRFSDIANYVAISLIFTLFPYAAELHASGRGARSLVLKICAAIIASSAALAAFFWTFGERLLALLPHGADYSAYWWAIPWAIGIAAASSMVSAHVTSEISANRFGYLKWMVPVCGAYAVALLAVTGHGHFAGIMPAAWSGFLASHNVTSLQSMMWWITGFNLAKLAFCAAELLRAQKGKR